MWYGDGTFHVAPQHFYQLYTLHGVVMGQLLPLVYCLLARKHRPTYLSLFQIIKSKLEELGFDINVESFRCDFEDAAIKGFFDVFPDVSIDCCFFHLAQAHWRKICDLGLRQAYFENENISTNLKMISALAFVPQSRIKSTLDELKENLPEATSEMVSYVERTNVGYNTYTSRPNDNGTMVSRIYII